MTMTERPSVQYAAKYKGIDYSRHCGVGYPSTSLGQDLKRLHRLWRKVQSDRHRDAIYDFLTAVYDLVEVWQVEGQVGQRVERALAITGLSAREQPEPFAAVLTAAVAPDRLERRKLSKYSRTLRLAISRKPPGKRLEPFIKKRGGLNGCASEFAKQRTRGRGLNWQGR